MKKKILQAASISCAILLSGAVGCTSQYVPTPTPNEGTLSPLVYSQVEDLRQERVPGTVTYEWVEPMYDTIEVPGQLDATGTYYRLPHRTVVEIRQDRFQHVQYPDSQPAPAPR